MARVTTVNKSMKDQACGRCGTELPKGSAYRWAKPGFRSHTRMIRCTDLACAFRQSELTTSKLAGVYAAQEDANDRLDGWDGAGLGELQSLLDDAAAAAGEVAEEYRDASQNWGDNGNEEWDGYADEIESWISELESVDLNEFDADAVKEEVEAEDHGGAEEMGQAFEEKRQEWADEQIQLTRDAVDSLAV